MTCQCGNKCSTSLRIIVPGIGVSANKNWGFSVKTKRVYKTTEAKLYTQRIRSISFSEMLKAGWKPDKSAVAVTIEVYNMAMDVCNAEKIVSDALQGSAYHNDRSIEEAHQYRRKDAFGPRLEITVERLAR